MTKGGKNMASDIFLKIDGIPGESYSDKHKNEIDILAWSWGVSQQGGMHVGGGGGSGRASVNDINFTKKVDIATNKLYDSCCSGKHIAKMILSCNKAGGQQLEFIKVSLTDCLITSVSTGGSDGANYTENVTVSFAKATMDYTQQDEKGSKIGNNSFTYDVKANKTA